MPYLVAGALLLCFGIWLAIVVITIVAWLFPFLMMFGSGWAFVAACLVLAGRGSPAAVLVTPNDVAGGTAGLREQRGPFARDWAWPSYLAAQWRRDLLGAWRTGLGFIVRGWRWGLNYGYASRFRWVSIGLTVLVWSGVSLGAMLGAVQVVVLGAIALGLGWLGWGVLVGCLRGYDHVVRRLRKASGSCPVCYHVMAVPAYRCSGCQVVHHDIRPGVLGAMSRICGCGAKLPTTVLRASRRLEALCQRCDLPLRGDSGAVTDIRVPVFGPVSAGKTRLVHAGLVALRDRAAAEGVVLDFVDDASRQAFAHGEQLITSGGDTAKTPAGQPPPAITARFTRGGSAKARGQALVHLFDAAGEYYSDRDDNSELEFLDHAGGLVFVVDPFAIGWVRDQLGGSLESLLAQAHPASGDPDQVYQVTARRLRDYGVQTNRRALAITVVKADLLTDLPWAADLCAGAVRDWLETAGLDNLVRGAERDFGEVRYFVVSSVTGIRPGQRLTPAAPFRWLLGRGGFALGRDEKQTTERV
ncbi:TRAFAC clade GTPase domain-containing protein [Saccharopolyspora sp. 5N708]|uniref:TRAFAC clade GTPase domain-containing protein n=1 Tax=Saccharopolyspora sp. 5N708 TaxID=3457424 RepID=UPI003FCEEDF9